METNPRLRTISRIFVATQLAALALTGLAAGTINFQAGDFIRGWAWVVGILLIIFAVIGFNLPNRIVKIPSIKVIVFIVLTSSIVSVVLAYWHASFYFELPPGLEDDAGARNLRSVAAISLCGYGIAFAVNIVYLFVSRRQLEFDVHDE